MGPGGAVWGKKTEYKKSRETVPLSASWLKKDVLTINLRGIYTAPFVMILMRGIHITRAIGRIVLKVEPVLGPGITRA